MISTIKSTGHSGSCFLHLYLLGKCRKGKHNGNLRQVCPNGHSTISTCNITFTIVCVVPLWQNNGAVLLKEVLYLIRKDLVLEWRQKYAFNGMLLYVGSTVFVCYLSFGLRSISGQGLVPVWNAVLWIILLFTSVNAIAKSFMQENRGRLLYFYTIVSPQGVILAKIVYNTLLMLVLALICFVFYAVVLGNPVQDMPMFLLTILLGAIGFSTSLTMISGIASKAANSSTLMAVLGFPVMVPMLLMLIRMSKNALDGLERGASLDELLTLLAINMIVVTVSYILFPYLWRS